MFTRCQRGVKITPGWIWDGFWMAFGVDFGGFVGWIFDRIKKKKNQRKPKKSKEKNVKNKEKTKKNLSKTLEKLKKNLRKT